MAGPSASASTASSTGPRRRHPRLGAARQRRSPDGPVVQVSPPPRRGLRRLRRAERADADPPRPAPGRAEHPRHDPGAPRGTDRREPEPMALARLRPRRGQRPPRHAVLGRLLLQDLHVAARLLGPRLRAGHPQRRRPGRRADRARRRPLRQPLRPHRRADRRRRPRRPRRRPRRRPLRREGHARRRDRRARRQPALRARRHHRRQARLGLARPDPGRAGRACRTSR